MKPWQTLATAPSAGGELELRRRGEGDFLLLVDGRVLMNSRAHRSEAVLAQLACEPLSDVAKPRLLIGGLGMGFTLRAALDALPAAAEVVVAELEPSIVDWCRGPLASLTDAAVDDPRVTVAVGDVLDTVGAHGRKFDAIALDLFEGPGTGENDPLFGRGPLTAYRRALCPGGTLAVWSEGPVPAFEKRLRKLGFDPTLRRPGKGGLRHAVYLARLAPPNGERRTRKPAR